ncbi:MAG: DUF427 domain-containing protein [Geodermatophilaceae bacterium]|nr:DUF427 domain-containing protein [Geodermatophilaceae bacterium]
MSLTFGPGPLAFANRDRFNTDLSDAPKHLLYLHDVEKRIRGVLDGETVVDTRRGKLLHESGVLPQWYLPLDDIRADLLVESSTTTHCPFKGDASYYSLQVGDRLVEDAIWTYRTPLPESAWLEGLTGFYFDRLDTWFEEDDEVFAHPRDPFHRVDTHHTSRHVVVRAGGETVADTTRAIALFETGLGVRYYLPEADVRSELLGPSDTTTQCAYKGAAGYRNLTVGAQTITDAAWFYADPFGEATEIAGYLSFAGTGLDVEVTDA